jgi:hypothetical protein
LTDYWKEINLGNYYLCDRCKIVKLRVDEYDNNIRHIENSNDYMRYCDECRNWLTLQTWTDSRGDKHTIRSERILDNL